MFGFALSGLQEFLYDLSPQSQSREQRGGAGGRDRDAARRLRIRSAILTLVPALVAHELLKRDPQAEIVYLGGGKLLLSANQRAAEGFETQTLVPLRDWLALSSSGKLGAYWALRSADCDAEGIKALLIELSSMKWKAGRTDGGEWTSLAGKIHAQTANGSLGDRKWESEVGGVFARREDWQGFRVAEGNWEIGPWRVRPVNSDPHIALRSAGPVEVAIPTFTPKKNGDTIPLFELAEEDAEGNERGGAYLALLKLDGDGIGNLMGEALDRGKDEYKRVSTKLTEFFGTDLMDFLRREYPRIYLVYSGGDDLVAAGWFDDVIRAALAIRSKYAELKLSTVSAGITFFTRQSSILKAIEAAEEELENAKRTRDAISLAGCRLNWDEMATTLKEIDGLVQAIGDKSINRGALQLLRQLGEPWLPNAPSATRDQCYRSIPMIYYARSRRTEWKDGEWPSLVRALFDSLQTDETDWPRAALVGTLAAWTTKKLQEEA